MHCAVAELIETRSQTDSFHTRQRQESSRYFGEKRQKKKNRKLRGYVECYLYPEVNELV